LGKVTSAGTKKIFLSSTRALFLVVKISLIYQILCWSLIKMILMQKFRRFLLTISLSILLITVTAFGFGTMDSWAANIPTQLANRNQAEIMTPKMVQDEEANRFKSESVEGMNKSIVNPNYQPGGKTKQSAREDRQDLKDIKTEASDSMDSYVDE
jgi:hypothetical protein